MNLDLRSGGFMFDINIHVKKERAIAMHLSEKLKVISGIFGLRLGEEPEYYLIRSNGEKEIRKYSKLTLATISVPFNENPQAAETKAYQVLSRYLLGKNDSSEHIEMTASMLREITNLDDGDGFLTMSFILPNKFSLKNAPQPNDRRIKLHQKDAQMVACRSFNGPTDDKKVQQYTTELREWLGQYSSYRAESNVKLAVCNRPQTLPFLRKNEIHIDVRTVN